MKADKLNTMGNDKDMKKNNLSLGLSTGQLGLAVALRAIEGCHPSGLSTFIHLNSEKYSRIGIW